MRERENFWNKLGNIGAALRDALVYVWNWINWDALAVLFVVWLIVSMFIVVLQPNECVEYFTGSVDYITDSDLFLIDEEGNVIEADWDVEDFYQVFELEEGDEVNYCRQVGSVYHFNLGYEAFEDGPD